MSRDASQLWSPTQKTLAAISVVVGIVVLAVFFRGANRNFALEVSQNGRSALLGNVVLIKNVGTEPVTLRNIIVNEREDCNFREYFFKTFLTPGSRYGLTKEYELKVGDEFTGTTFCAVVRVAITTDKGRNVYSFQK